MATYYPGTYIQLDVSSTDRMNYIVDQLLLPRLYNYRQMRIFDEKPILLEDGETWQVTYHHWNDGPIRLYKNGKSLITGDYTDLSRVNGTFKTGTWKRGDDVRGSYEFDYFPTQIMEGIIKVAIDQINTGAVGPVSNYSITDAPENWDGIIADLAFAQCMERLLLDFTLWKGRLIFAIGNDLLSGGGGDITGVLETLKTNAEERANRALDNELLKAPHVVAKPTKYYYQSLSVGGGSSQGANSSPMTYGKFRGIHINKYLGGSL